MLMLMYVKVMKITKGIESEREKETEREAMRVSHTDRKKEYINNYHIKTLATWAEC